jgi:hypothetical protein
MVSYFSWASVNWDSAVLGGVGSGVGSGKDPGNLDFGRDDGVDGTWMVT